MTKQSRKRLNLALYCVLALGLFSVGAYNFNQLQSNEATARTMNSEVNSLQNADQKLIKEVKTPKYIVNAKGHMDYTAQQTISNIKSLFSNVDTWKSQAQYIAHRNQAKQFVKDPQFFKQYLKEYVDEDGNYELDALKLKSRSAGTQVYEIRPGQYLVIASMYFYHNPKDFTQKAAMTTSKRVFIFEGDASRISKAKRLKNLE